MKNETLEELLLLDETATKNRQKVQGRCVVYLPFHLSVINDNVEEIKKYIAAGYDINIKDCFGNSALYYAVKYYSNLDTFKLLIDAGGDYEYKYNNCSLLHSALAIENFRVAEYLIEELHFDVNEASYDDHTPLWYALVLHQDLDIAGYLLNHGAHFLPDEKNMSHLFWAIKEQNNELWRLEKRVEKLEKKIQKLKKL